MVKSTPKINSVELPLRLKTLRAYAEDIFAPIRRGENVSTIWSPMIGRRVRNKFIITYPNLFKEQIGDKNYLLVYVEPLELTEESNSGYITLITNSILETWNQDKDGELQKFSPHGSYGELLENLRHLINEIVNHNFEIVLFLGEFDELEFTNSVLYNNLKSIWTKSNNKLHFVFLLLSDVTRPESVKKFDELNELLLTNVVYIPLPDKDTDYLINYFCKQLNRKFSQEETQLLREACGGHPYLLKSCTRLIALTNGHKLKPNELEEMLISHFEPRSAAQKIFNLLEPEEQAVLRKIVKAAPTSLPANANLLEKLGLIKKSKDGAWVPFGKILASVASQKKSVPSTPQTDGSLAFDKTTGAIFIGSTNVEEKFTRQEYETLRFLLSEPEKLRTREEVGEAMWGKESYDKYSDWAIDQVISKIRRKIEGLGVREALITVRGRGYKINLAASDRNSAN